MQRLSGLAMIIIKQKVELLEVMTGFETNNKYEIKDGAGLVILTATEETNVCGRCCCGRYRSFVIHITNSNGVEVIRVSRDYCKACSCLPCCSCGGCCQDRVNVEAPPGNEIGYVSQSCSCCRANFSVVDSQGAAILQLKGPCYCACRCPGQKYTFQVTSTDGNQNIGSIQKEWSGFAREVFTDADQFAVNVPADMSVAAKALLIGATLLIDFMFFEEDKGNKNGPTLA